MESFIGKKTALLNNIKTISTNEKIEKEISVIMDCEKNKDIQSVSNVKWKNIYKETTHLL